MYKKMAREMVRKAACDMPTPPPTLPPVPPLPPLDKGLAASVLAELVAPTTLTVAQAAAPAATQARRNIAVTVVFDPFLPQCRSRCRAGTAGMKSNVLAECPGWVQL